MTVAKHLHGVGKTDAIKSSFEKKLEYMQCLLKTWKNAGKRDDSFWPESLRALAEWNVPELGIYEWSSNNVTKRGGRYKDQVARYWKLQGDAQEVGNSVDDSPKIVRLKAENVRQGEQIMRLQWEVMEYRDEIIRLNPKSDILTRIPFPQ